MARPNLNISEMSNNETDALHGEDELGNLGLTAFNQDEFEKDVMEKVNKEMKDSENLRLRNIRDKSLKKTEYGMRSLNTEVSSLQSSINLLTRQLKVNFDVEGKKKLIDLQASHASKLKELADMKANRMKLLSTLNKTDNASLEEALGLSIKQTEETERERLIRTGVIMPFDVTPDQKASTSKQAEPGVTSFEQYLLDQSQKTSERHGKKTKKKKIQKRTQNVAKIKTESPLKKRKLTKSHSTPLLQKSRDQARKASKNIFDATSAMVKKRSASELEQSSSRMDTRDRTGTSRIQHNFSEDIALSSGEEVYEDEIYKDRCANDVDDDYNPSDMSDEYYEEDYEPKQSRVSALPKHRKSKMFMDTSELTSRGKRKKSCSSGDESLDEIKHKFGARKCAKAKNRATDDGDNQMYKDRLRKYTKQKAKRKYKQLNEHDDQADSEDELVSVSGQFKIPVVMWNKLYSYQQTCVRWLWELHIQECGGIMGDEMGLGKTIQTIAFLTALKVTKHHDAYFTGLGPTILICPATVMHQWVRELHKWWPEFRVAILHSSGSYTCTDSSLIHSIVRSNGILITSYTSVVKHRPALLEHDWHYVILDEGHKIRNPDAQATIACKQFRTSHRLILSGSPIQNNLRELWSLFDFVFPGKLGTLPDFMQHFSVPIVQGGYSNASQIQVQTAYKCASVLRDTINPYLLRRMKADVKQILNLPSKNEQVLFCRLTKEQRDVYQEYIDSKECQMILSREFMIFPGLITLRKICNHPDLCTGGPGMLTSRNYDDEQLTYGHKDRSGKLIVVASLLKLWKKQGQRVLLFTQSKQMLDIMETFVQSEHYQYLRMDGGTGVASRQPLINKFNEDEKYFLFLLTTRVGGLGINLTGANRVVIFDPDWNPSTDMQARERAWRIGQQKQVTVYRLLTAGTIEEKIYHRQIFKQFLCNRVLKDPKQRRFFKSNDLFELFTLGTDDSAGHTETGAIFAGTGTVITEKSKSKLKKNNTEKKSKTNRFDEIRASIEERKNGHTSVTEEEKEDDDEAEMIRQLGEERRQKMREMAKKLSMKISKDVLQRKDSAKSEPTTEGCSNIQIVQGSAHSIVKPEPSPDDTVHPCAMHPGNIIKEEPLWDSDQYGTGSNVYDEQTDLGSTNEGIKEEPSCTVRDSSVCIKQEPQSDGEVTEDQPSTSFQPTPFTSGLLDFNQLVSNSDRAIVKKSDVHKPRKLKPAKSTIKKHSKKHTSTGKAKKKKKKRKDIVFEGEVIPNLLRQSALQQSDEKEAEQNDYVLQRLLKKSGVSSALQHDKIMMSSSPDYVIIESEAERIAKQAARALKQSRSRCNPAQTGRPTWTGQQGTIAKPRFGQKKNALVRHAESTVNPSTSTTVSEEITAEDKVMTWNTNVNKPLTADEREKNPAKKLPSTPALFDGTLAGQRQTSTPSTNQNAGKQSSVNTMTSADLLTAMRSRNHLSGLTNQDSDSDNNDIVENVPTDNMELITDIRNFISFQGSVDGQATTEEILSEFKTRIDPTDSVTFKSMLKEICNFDKNNGVGLWQLKQQYR